MLTSRRSRAGAPGRGRGRGVALVEALVAMVIFVIGVVGMLRLQAVGAERERDALYRAEAAAFAAEILGVMWTDAGNLAAYRHRTGGVICDPSGAATTNANALLWLDALTQAGSARRLPGAESGRQQILVDTSVTPAQVRVHLCWRSPQDDGWRSYAIVSRVPA